MTNCKEECLKYLKYSRTEKEVFSYLSNQGFDYEEINESINYAKELKYIDDCDYAYSFTKDHLVINKWGPVKIKMKLKEKGIPDEYIDNALLDYEEHIIYNLEEQLSKKIASYQEIDHQTKNKIIRHLINKGYNYDMIKRTMDSYEWLCRIYP